MSDDQRSAWAKAIEERLIGLSEQDEGRLTTRLEGMEHRMTGAILKLIAKNEERLTPRINGMFSGNPKPPEN